MSTALNAIIMPVDLFEAFAIAVRVKNPDFQVSGNQIIAPKACSHYMLHNLSISINDLEYRIS